MEKKSRALIYIFLILVTASVVMTFYRYIIKEDILYETDEELFQESLLEEE